MKEFIIQVALIALIVLFAWASKNLTLKFKTAEKKIKSPPLLYEQTQTVIKEITALLDGDFISYWGAFNSQITRNDSVAFNEVVNGSSENSEKKKRLYLFIKSGGGSGEASLRTIHFLREKYEEIIAVAPLTCASAATMLALGADKILMGPLSYLTAVDTSLTHNLSPLDADKDNVSVSQNELDRVLKLWNERTRENDKNQNPYKSLYKYIHPLVFGAVDRASSLSIKLTNEILSYHMKDETKIHEISNHLNSDYPSHNYPITYLEAKKIGLHTGLLSKELNDKLMQLNNLYSEMAQYCYTDYNEYKYHNNQIYTIIEAVGKQIYFQTAKDFVWRKEDQEWTTTNDHSSWKIYTANGIHNFHIR